VRRCAGRGGRPRTRTRTRPRAAQVRRAAKAYAAPVRRPDPHHAVAAFFVAAGVLHFLKPRPYEAIVPPALPGRRELVYLSGVAEIAGGLAALPERARAWAGWYLIALLLAVFPANVYHALAADEMPDQPVPRPLLFLRLPVQGLLIAWVWRATGAGRALDR
jgi:uncharacterized membrane protein